MALVPAGLVANRVNEMAKHGEDAGGHASTELSKKLRHFLSNHMQDRRRLRTTAPARHNENLEPKLLGLGAARGSFRSLEPHSVAPPTGGVSVRDEIVQQQRGEPKESWFSKWDW
jgi:hypothetical protein